MERLLTAFHISTSVPIFERKRRHLQIRPRFLDLKGQAGVFEMDLSSNTEPERALSNINQYFRPVDVSTGMLTI